MNRSLALIVLLVVVMALEGGGVVGGRNSPFDPVRRDESILETNLLVTWYGNPHTPRMGVLGRYTGAELAAGLRKQAGAYAGLTHKAILPGYHLVAVVAQPAAGRDGLWRRRESREVITSLLHQARAAGFKLVLDVQVGRSTVPAELSYLQPYLEEPDVYLALDPEFAMDPGTTPGIQIGHLHSTDINYALAFLEEIITSRQLPPKVLIVHQFTMRMLPDKETIGRSSVVDLVLNMDGFGVQWLKRDTYRMIMKQWPLQYAGIKIFYDQDEGLFTPEQVMMLNPVPSVVIYQ